MSLSETELIYLMAYVDGQVDDDELPEVLELLKTNDEARQIVAQHAALGDWVRQNSDERAEAAGADRIADRVLVEIEKLGGGKVIVLEKERARHALNRQRVKEFGALVAVAAMAAAFLLMPSQAKGPVAANGPKPPSSAMPMPLLPVGAPPTNTGGTGSVVAVAPSSSANGDGEVAVATNTGTEGTAGTGDGEGDAPMDVQTVDSPDHPFSIFYVPAATGLEAHASSVVVWIGE